MRRQISMYMLIKYNICPIKFIFHNDDLYSNDTYPVKYSSKLFADDEEIDEFFDCRETMDDSSSLAKWSSMELMPMESSNDLEASHNESIRQRGSLQNSTKLKSNEPTISVRRVHSLHMSSSTSPIPLNQNLRIQLHRNSCLASHLKICPMQKKEEGK